MQKDNIVEAKSQDRVGLEYAVWDLYRDVHGIRPRGMKMELYSDEELADYANTLAEWVRADQKEYEASLPYELAFEDYMRDMDNLDRPDPSDHYHLFEEALEAGKRIGSKYKQAISDTLKVIQNKRRRA